MSPTAADGSSLLVSAKAEMLHEPLAALRVIMVQLPASSRPGSDLSASVAAQLWASAVDRRGGSYAVFTQIVHSKRFS